MLNQPTNLVDLDHTAQNQGEHSNDQPPNDHVVASAEGTGSSDHISDVPANVRPDEGNTASTGTATPSHQSE